MKPFVLDLCHQNRNSFLGYKMSESLLISLFIIAILFLVFYGLWSIPNFSGLPWRPTSAERVRRALKMAKIQPGEVIYDLGSGDGRVLLQAVREFQVNAVGLEISPLLCLVSWLLVRANRLEKQVTIRRRDFYTTNLGQADVVFAYMTSRQVPRLLPHLEKQLKPGARVVTISFDLDGWEPQLVDREQLVFLYQMPPQPGSLGTYLAKTL